VPLRLHPAQGDPVVIEAERSLVGRDRTAEVRINESSISRKHATVEHRGADWVILDNGSANGTFVDNVQVAEVVLRNGQTLRLGAVSFRVEIEIPPSPTQTLRPQDRPSQDPKTQPAIPRYQPAVAPAPPAPPPPPAVPAVLSMNATQAAEILGVAAGAPPADVRRQYQRLHNDLQIRLNNTPSPSLKRMYQKNLQELKLACELLAPGQSSG
jgi:predicted component of type VI protein secretion system